MFAYISGAPAVFITQLGVAPGTFALFFGLNAAGLIAMSQWNRVLLERRSPAAIVRFGVGLELFAGLGLVLVAAFAPRLETIAPCLWGFVASLGVVTPNTVALSLEAHGARAGVASALMGSLQFAVSATASALVAVLANQTAVPMAAVMFGCACFAGLMQHLASRQRSAAPE
jgi:DHA1 family bicyclomycin/chloramphenicol resistance-like MFS transporter